MDEHPLSDDLFDLFAKLQEGVCILSADGRVIAVNDALTAMNGFSREESVGRPLGEFVRSGAQAEGFDALLKQLAERGSAALETEAVRKDGAVSYIEVRAHDLETDDGKIYVVLCRDITERRRTAEALRKSRDILKGLVNAAPLAVIAWDTDFKVTEWNPAAERIFGFSRDEAIGSGPEFIVPESAKQYVTEKWRNLMGGRGGLRGTNENQTRDGRIILCEWYNDILYDGDGNVSGVTSQVADTTEERAVLRERDRLLSALEQSDDAFVFTDVDGTIRYVNSAYERMTGYPRREAVGRNPRILKSNMHDQAFYAQMWNTILAGENWRGDIVNRRKDGVLYTEQMTISPVLEGDGEISGFVATKRDVTAARSAEAMLQQAQKMESVGRLAGGIAHDFNNMLNVILGYTEMIMQDLEDGNPIKEDLEEVRKAARHSADLTRQLLAFSRKQIIEPKVIELNAVIDPMRRTIARLIGEDIQLEFRPGGDLWNVRIDPAQVDQMLANLCVNARDAMPGGGRLVIETANHDADRIDVSAHPDAGLGDYVVLTVEDTGMGVSEDALPYLFEPFFTTKREGEGTGLGLSTVQGIVRQNGGFIGVESELERGTIFHIHLPRCRDEVSESFEEEEIVIGDLSGRVLLVEDDDMLRDLIHSKLKQAGFEVVAAEAPLRALELFEPRDEPFDLLLTDVVMPGMNGKELHDRLQSRQGGLRTLFMSGYTADIISNQGVLEEGLNFLPKPFSMAELIAKIREVLAG